MKRKQEEIDEFIQRKKNKVTQAENNVHEAKEALAKCTREMKEDLMLLKILERLPRTEPDIVYFISKWCMRDLCIIDDGRDPEHSPEDHVSDGGCESVFHSLKSHLSDNEIAKRILEFEPEFDAGTTNLTLHLYGKERGYKGRSTYLDKVSDIEFTDMEWSRHKALFGNIEDIEFFGEDCMDPTSRADWGDEIVTDKFPGFGMWWVRRKRTPE